MGKPVSDWEQWTSVAASLKDTELPTTSVPLHVLFGEAVDVAKFFDTYWSTQTDADGNVVRLGLDSAVAKPTKKSTAKPSGPGKRLSAKTGSEILSLQRAAQEAHTRYLLTINPKTGLDPVARGQFLLNEITAALEWYFDDGVEDEKDEQLARVGAAHADDPQTADALASALDDYAFLAAPYREDLHGLGGFDAGLLDEARTIAAALRDKPATATSVAEPTRAALDLRNRLVALLVDRINAVRAAARFVFRNRPEIIRNATSAYERRKRAAARRAKAKPNPTPSAPSIG